MQASIDFDGTLTGSIAGGGGGGSDVSITPTYNQGKKIADYSIDGNGGAIYTPEIEISKNVLSGVKICEIEGVEIFAPSYGYIDTLGDSNVEQIGGFSQGANVTPVNAKRVSYSNNVSNGETIGVLSVGDTDYSIKQKKANIIDSNEKVIGTWFGEMLYQQCIDLSSITISAGSTVTVATIQGINLKMALGTLTETDGTTYAIPDGGLRVKQYGDDIKLTAMSGSSWVIVIGKLIIEYTKTS